MLRYVTYEIEKGNHDDELCGFLIELGAEAVTSSTYKIDTSIDLKKFCAILKNFTSSGDQVSVIYQIEDTILHKTIR